MKPIEETSDLLQQLPNHWNWLLYTSTMARRMIQLPIWPTSVAFSAKLSDSLVLQFVNSTIKED